jgi:hypothetical protein
MTTNPDTAAQEAAAEALLAAQQAEEEAIALRDAALQNPTE